MRPGGDTLELASGTLYLLLSFMDNGGLDEKGGPYTCTWRIDALKINRHGMGKQGCISLRTVLN
jgi:hypothetical protein